MARQTSIIKFQGTLDEMTQVNSRTYPEHLRRRRGSKKKAELNDAFKASGLDLQAANIVAKLIFDAIEPHRQNFKGGLMWQRLVSVFKAQYKERRAFNFLALTGFEIWKEHPLERFLAGQLSYKVSFTQILQVRLLLLEHPDFKRKYVDAYRLSLIAFFPSAEQPICETAAVQSSITSLQEPVKDFYFEFPLPEYATEFLLCLKAEGCEKGYVVNSFTVKGMRFIGGGRII